MNLVFTVHKLSPERRKAWKVIATSGKIHGLKLLEFQEETSESGQPHLQGYMELSTFYRYKNLIKLCGGDCWFMKRKGTRCQALHYIRKPVKGCRCRHCRGKGVYNGGLRVRYVK